MVTQNKTWRFSKRINNDNYNVWRKSTSEHFDLGAVISSLLKTLPLPSIQPTWPALSVRGRARGMLSVHSPEVNENLLRLLQIQREIVVTAPPGQAAHLAPVVCLISVADETHHSRVIRKFNEEIGVV